MRQKMRQTSFTCHGTSLSGIIGIAALMIISIILTSARAAEKQISAVINAGKTGEPISNKIYGQFLEHIGGIVISNLWAEMLNGAEKRGISQAGLSVIKGNSYTGRVYPEYLGEWAYTGAQTDSQNAVLAYSWAIQEMFRQCNECEYLRIADFRMIIAVPVVNRIEKLFAA